MKLSDGERLILAMLSDVYRHFNINGEIDSKLVMAAMHSGNLWGLKLRYSGLFDVSEAEESVIQFVVDTLDMWGTLELAYEELPTPERKRVDDEVKPFGDPVRFRGFDGNNETEYYGVASFLINDLKRFQTFKDHRLNSHVPCVDAYRRMLDEFLPIRDKMHGTRMTADQIISAVQKQAMS